MLSRFSAPRSSAEILAGAANPYHAAEHAKGLRRLRLPQAKLSRNSNQIALGRIRRFEFQADRSALHPYRLIAGRHRGERRGRGRCGCCRGWPGPAGRCGSVESRGWGACRGELQWLASMWRPVGAKWVRERRQLSRAAFSCGFDSDIASPDGLIRSMANRADQAAPSLGIIHLVMTPEQVDLIRNHSMRCGQPIEVSPRYFTVDSSNSRPMRDGCFPTIWNGSNLS